MARAEYYGVTHREGSQQIDQITSCSKLTNEIYGVELFPMVAAASPLRDQLNGMRIIFLVNGAAAGPLVRPSAQAPEVLALIEGF